MSDLLDKISHWTLYAFAALCWVSVPVLLVMAFEPVPLTVAYVAPAFISHPVNHRPAADEYVFETPGGVTLWRYVEACVSRPFNGDAHRSWVAPAFVWNVPVLPTVMSRTPGCHNLSIAVEVPTSSPSRDFQFVQHIEVEVNVLRTANVDFPPIPLRILSPEDAARKHAGERIRQ